MIAVVLMLTACDPWRAERTDEVVWGSAARLEAERGIQTVEMVSGEPLKPHPRIVIHPDRIDIDNRAWILNLPPEVLDDPDLRELAREALHIETGAAQLTDGVPAHDELQGTLLLPLYESVLEMREGMARIEDQTDADIEQYWGLNVIPHPDTPSELIRNAMLSAGQAGFGLPVMVGQVDGHLRGATAGRAEPYWGVPCAIAHNLELKDDGLVLTALTGPPLTQGDVCPTTRESLPALLDAITAQCKPRWGQWHEQAHAVALEDHFPVSPSSWQCLTVRPILNDGVTATDILATMALGYDRYPDVHFPLPWGGSLDSYAPGCEGAFRVEDLSSSQWDAVCGLGEVQDRLAQDMLNPEQDRQYRFRLQISTGPLVGAFPEHFEEQHRREDERMKQLRFSLDIPQDRAPEPTEGPAP